MKSRGDHTECEQISKVVTDILPFTIENVKVERKDQESTYISEEVGSTTL